jgi:L-arabinose isomerase
MLPSGITRRKPLEARVGLFGVGHYAYWPQFPGLKESLLQKQETVANILRGQTGVVVSDFGMVDCAEEAYALVPRLEAANLDMVFCDMLTYATSSTFGVIAKRLNIPVVLVALQPDEALDYDQASTHKQLYNDDICSVPEFAGVAVRMGKRVPPVIVGTLRELDTAEAELARYCGIARVLHDLKKARIGQMGHVLESMLDMHTDPTQITATFGCHVVQCEPHDLLAFYQEVEASLIANEEERILAFFDTPDPGSDPITEKLRSEDLRVAARAGVALRNFVDAFKLDGLAYYYQGLPATELRELMSNLIVGNSLLTAAGFPMCGELDLKTCLAMLIMDRLEMGGSFAEFHPIDFREGFVLVGHDGPHHIGIAEGKPVLRSLKKYHGKPGSGAGVEFQIREGPITMLSIGQTHGGGFKFVIAEGHSQKGPIPPTGNTNTRGLFKPDVVTFLKRWFAEGPTHHFALGVGHQAETLEEIGAILGVETVIIPTE